MSCGMIGIDGIVRISLQLIQVHLPSTFILHSSFNVNINVDVQSISMVGYIPSLPELYDIDR